MLKINYLKVIIGAVTLIILIGAVSVLYLNSIPKIVTTKKVVGRGLVAELPPESLFGSSTLVVEGELEKQTEPFAVQGQNGEFQVYTDYYFRIHTVLRGTEDQEVIAVRRPGGFFQDTEYTTEYDIKFSYDQNYLLCLYKVNYGGGTNTEGDYYAVNGVYQGAFEEVSPMDLQNIENYTSLDSGEKYFANCWFLENYQSDPDADASSNSMQKEMAAAITEMENGSGYTSNLVSMMPLCDYLEKLNVETPANENFSKEEILDNLQANLESGFVNREEYDFVVASLDCYGEIVSDYIVLDRNGIATE